VARSSLLLVIVFSLATSLPAQNLAPKTQAPATSPDSSIQTLRTTSRAVLVDVIVSGRDGRPVTGIKQDAFTVTEQGNAQTVSFFDEHTGKPGPLTADIEKLPPNTFTNFSPFPQPAAVNVLLLDSLNTRMESQSVVHSQAMKFLKDLKPGSRIAIFTMGLGLHFVQGFTDDPALLFAALGNKKNNEVQSSVMLKGQEETNVQQNLVGMMSAAQGNGATAASPEMISSLVKFMQENDESQEVDRVLLTLANLQRLATFLNGFPGRKNVIWFSESPMVAGRVDPQTEQEWEKTRNMLAAARVALYPVDARGVSTVGFYQADNALTPSIGSASQVTSAQLASVAAEAQQRDAEQSQMKRLADDTGGRAFVNTNGLSEVMTKINTESADFYTISYTPTDVKMDGTFRKIEVKVAGGKFNVSYRRGYFARDMDMPGAALATRDQAIQKLAAEHPGAVDPLLPFMDLGMPQSMQIVYKMRIQLLPVSTAAASDAAKSEKATYAVDFFIDLNSLELTPKSNGNHQGKLNICLIAYDRYGNIAARKDHIVALDIKPNVYDVFKSTGVQLHAEIAVPKGQFWLRTGIHDQASLGVGTLEIPLSAVKPLSASIQ
jgi:VWFA-related protein